VSRHPACEIAVVGGGMVGAALALQLAELGFMTAVIEPQPPAPPDDSEIDLRVSAIAPDSRALLERLDTWKTLAVHAGAYRAMEVWDGTGNGRTRFDTTELGVAELGHIVENRRIQHALWRRLADHPNAHCHATRVAGLLVTRDTAQLELADGSLLPAQLIVGADGARSRIRDWAGLQTVGWDYGQKTIVGNLRSAESHQATCWQRFLPSGPVAFLPLANGSCSLAWHVTTRHADHLLALDEALFAAELEVASGGMLGTINEIGRRAAFPLHLRHALGYHAPRVVLIGDAAHAIHPLAGQGVNLGFRDVEVLADALATGRERGRDAGDADALASYQRHRQPNNGAMLLAMDAFKRGFGNDQAVLRVARNLGLDLADRSGPLKRALMHRAMGV